MSFQNKYPGLVLSIKTTVMLVGARGGGGGSEMHI